MLFGLSPRSPVTAANVMAPRLPVKYERTCGVLQEQVSRDLQLDEIRRPVPFMGPAQRSQFLVEFDANRRPYYFRDGARVHLAPSTVHLFVMDERGRIYAGTQREVVHHSSFLASHPAAASGTLEVLFDARTGCRLRISDESGHYSQPREHTRQFFRELQERGITRARVEFGAMFGQTEQAAEAALRGSRRKRLYPGDPKWRNVPY